MEGHHLGAEAGAEPPSWGADLVLRAVRSLDEHAGAAVRHAAGGGAVRPGPRGALWEGRQVEGRHLPSSLV